MEQNHVVNLKLAPFSSFPVADSKTGSGSRIQERRFECGKRMVGDKKADPNSKDIQKNRAVGLNSVDWSKKSKQLWQHT